MLHVCNIYIYSISFCRICSSFNLLFLLRFSYCFALPSISLSFLSSSPSLFLSLFLSFSLSFDSNQRLVETKPLATSPSTCSLSFPFRIRGLSPQASYSGSSKRKGAVRLHSLFLSCSTLSSIHLGSRRLRVNTPPISCLVVSSPFSSLLFIWAVEGFESTLLLSIVVLKFSSPLLSYRCFSVVTKFS